MNEDFELPNLKKKEEETIEQPVPNNENQVLEEKIEIPQEYYDKLNKEKEERLQALAKKEEEHQATTQAGGTIFLIFLSFIVCGFLLYGMNNIDKLLIIGLPVYTILGSIVSGKTHKEDSKFGTSILISGMIGALICFILAMRDRNNSDITIYYAYAFFAVAFVGYVLSIVIIKLLFNKDVKALGKIFFVLVIAAILGVPYYFYSNNKADFIETVFLGKNGKEIVAESEKDYIERILKNRYGYGFTCEDKKKNYIDDLTHRRLSIRRCNSDASINLEVMSLFYDEDKKLYIVRDSYLDDSYINPFREELQTELNNALGSTSVKVGFYPDNKCYFIGDCDNNSNYEKEIELDNLYNYSSALKLQEYVGIDTVEFFNKYSFNYEIIVRGNYSDAENFEDKTNIIIDYLEQKGIKNKKGFTIAFRDIAIKSDVYKVSGKADSNGSFRNYQIVND